MALPFPSGLKGSHSSFARRKNLRYGICQLIGLTVSRNTASELGYGYHTTITSWRKSLPLIWFEIISENFMCDGGRPLHVLDQILEQYRVVQHGVSMYFGSAEPLNREHLKRLKAW